MTMDSQWIRRYHSPPGSDMRLVCLPHAGGSASFYLPVSRALPSLAREVCAALGDDAAGHPLALFGHSMGSRATPTRRQLWTRPGPGASTRPALLTSGFFEAIIFTYPEPPALPWADATQAAAGSRFVGSRFCSIGWSTSHRARAARPLSSSENLAACSSSRWNVTPSPTVTLAATTGPTFVMLPVSSSMVISSRSDPSVADASGPILQPTRHSCCTVIAPSQGC
jgi:hypothetical protein